MGGAKGVKVALDDTRQHDKPSYGDAPAKEKELAELCARFADLCQYFSQQNMDLPTRIVDQVQSVSTLAVEDRIARMKLLNEELMECLHGACLGPQVRQ